jgi:hypothetical protein
MFSAALAIPAPIPLSLDVTLEFGPVLLVMLLAVLDIGALAALRAAVLSRRSRPTPQPSPSGANVIPLRREPTQRGYAPTPPSCAA